MDSVEQDPFEVTVGDTYLFLVAVEGDKGAVPDMDGAVLDFGYGTRADHEDRENADLPSADPAPATVQKCGKTYPALLVSIPATESQDLVPGVIYHWAARVTIQGVVKTVASGTFTAVGVPL